MSLVTKEYEDINGFSEITADELFYVSGGCGSCWGTGGHGGGGTSLMWTAATSLWGR